MKLLLHSINIVRFVVTGVHLQRPLSGSRGASQFSRTGLAVSVVLSYIQKPVYADAARLKYPFLP